MALRDNLSEWAKVPFESTAHMVEAMRDPQYRDSRNPAYRQAVEAKIILPSNTGISATVYESAESLNTEAGIGETETEAAALRREEEHNAAQALVDTFGPMSVSPAERLRLAQAAPRPTTE